MALTPGSRLALLGAAVLAAVVATTVILAGRSDGRRARPVAAVRAAQARAAVRARGPLHVVASSAGRLPAPLQDAAGARAGGGALLLGGLTAADTSTAEILRDDGGRVRALARLPVAVHDAAAAGLGGAVYLFGGGDGAAQHDEIRRVDPVTGATRTVGHLPAPSSDQSAAAIGSTAYVVGGYTGARWLDTVVAWRPGASARVVAHLPSAVRYAAVASVGNDLVVAGGSLPDGTASDAVYLLRNGRAPALRIGRLPAPTTHATAATLGGTVLVIGGRGAVLNTPVARVVAVDVRARTVRLATRLRAPTSDATAVALRRAVLVLGGHTVRGTTADIVRLRATRAVPATPRTASVTNIYAADRPGALTGAARSALPRIYVPNSQSDTVDVIDPRTKRVVEHFAVGRLPQHVTPAYDLRTLYVLNDQGNSITPIDPRTAKPRAPIPVDDPYNMYFTPDGRFAIVVAERLHRLDFRDPHTFALRHSLAVPCTGVDHMDFSADGSYLIASCEFSGQMLKVNLAHQRVVGTLTLPDGAGAMPQDVKLSPDGRVFYVADMMAGGLWKLDGRRFAVTGFLRTGRGVHGLYPSRDSRLLYATNRGEGTISVISFRTGRIVTTWRIPGGGSPDMGGVSADGRVLWLSGRYNAEVYAIDTRNGRLLARIPVGLGPHGLCVWPQPGRYSLGHTGLLR